MRTIILFILFNLFSVCQGKGMQQLGQSPTQDLRPKGKLVYLEYVDTLDTGFLFDKFRARQLSDGRVEVFAFDYYEHYDSITVMGDRQPLDSIQRVINEWIEWFHPQGKRAHDECEKGRFTAVFDNGDTLQIDKLTWCSGMQQIQKYMRYYCDWQVTQMPLEEIKGPVPTDVYWHNGTAFRPFKPQKGLQAKRYRNARYEFVVFRNPKTRQVRDVWVKTRKDKEYDDIEQARLEMLSGVYQNERGNAVFGNVDDPKTTYYGDPGSDIRFRCQYTYEGISFTDTIDWGSQRIQEVNVPNGAPPGWGGAGAFTGPSTWTLKFTGKGLHVEELSTGVNAPTHPDFGKSFDLKKIRGPYRFCADPWAIACTRPLTRGQLSMLSITQLREMLAEFDKRHADGSKLSDLEQVNKSLVQDAIRRSRGK